jgi:chemotaxis protein methyltransferase CheR
VPPSERDWQAFFADVRQKTGLDLTQYKPAQLQRRIQSMAEERGVKSLGDLSRTLSRSDDDMQRFLDKLAINVSELFRNPEKWAELEKVVLPALISRSSALKCWSAGCSFGAEAHTLAVILDARFPGQHSVLGTDIDAAALAQAKRSEFNEHDMRGVPDDYRRRYFDRDASGRWRARSLLKKYLTFRRGDLLGDRFGSGYDLILCRNVVIYFTDDAKAALYERLYRALKPGGVLFVGSTERIFNAKQIGFSTTLPFFYQKPLEGPSIWRNAS